MFPLVVRQCPERIYYRRGFAGMPENRLHKRQRFAIVHESVAGTHAPERRGPHPQPRALRAVLYNTVSGPDIM